MAKTIYSSHLAGSAIAGTNKEIPIFMLTDEHLQNILRTKADHFCKNRQKFAEAPDCKDPMVTAMGKSMTWDAAKLQQATVEFMADFQPYVAEAVVRGGNVVNQAQESMRQVTKRMDAVVIQAQLGMDDAGDDIEVY